MNNFIQYLKNTFSFDFILSNLLWDLFVLIVISFFLVRFLPSILSIIKILKELLKENRDTFDNGYGKHLADRFINIWYNTKQPTVYIEGRFYRDALNRQSRYHSNDIDLELEKMRLIEIDYNYKIIKPIKKMRNRIIVSILIFYLINFIGDNKTYYDKLRK